MARRLARRRRVARRGLGSGTRWSRNSGLLPWTVRCRVGARAAFGERLPAEVFELSGELIDGGLRDFPAGRRQALPQEADSFETLLEALRREPSGVKSFLQ